MAICFICCLFILCAPWKVLLHKATQKNESKGAKPKKDRKEGKERRKGKEAKKVKFQDACQAKDGCDAPDKKDGQKSQGGEPEAKIPYHKKKNMVYELARVISTKLRYGRKNKESAESSKESAKNDTQGINNNKLNDSEKTQKPKLGGFKFYSIDLQE